MAFYFETSSINFLLNNLDDSEIILLRDGLKLVGDGKLCLSPITLWEIACTGKQETKEDLYRVCQILFEENWVLPSPIKLMDHYTASGAQHLKRKMISLTFLVALETFGVMYLPIFPKQLIFRAI